MVMAMATVLTTLGLVGVSQMIKDARYRADRTRFYMDMKEMRDRASHGMRHVTIKELATEAPGERSLVEYVVGISCNMGTSTIVDYPALDHAGDRAICHDKFGTAQFTGGPPPPGSDPLLDFIPVGGGATDIIEMAGDGALEDSWGEFADEGCLEANTSGDPDHANPCGD